MTRNKSIRLKAAFLLTVFGLNTLVSFACGALGVDMDFNTTHLKDAATEPSIHIHSDGKKHHHEPVPVKTNAHANEKKHKHDSEAAKEQPEEKNTSEKDKTGCCNDDVQKFQSLDKTLNQNARIAINAPALIAIISFFVGVDILKASVEPRSSIYRYLFPPPPDILVAIQRFQI